MKFLRLFSAPRARKHAPRSYRPGNVEAALFPISVLFGRGR